MTDHMRIGHLYPTAVPPGTRKTGNNPSVSGTDNSFQSILDSKTLKFSHHAEQRLKQRGIELKPEQISKIQSAVDKAAAKGAQDSLLIMSDLALIVNVSNRTIITAMNDSQLKDHVFTQIDSAVIVT